jgi:Na+-translocating ferredoxin:NAD+ oxidoreductase RnfE subunit
MKGSPSLLMAALLSLPVLAQAAEPEQCHTVNFSDVGWTDITVTTAVTSVVLESLGYSVVLLVVAFIRELGGSGSVFGVQIMPLISEGGWYQPMGILLMPPSAFIIIACFIWVLRTFRPEQVEKKA